MQRNHPQFARLLALDRRIRDGKYPNCLSFAAEWEVSQKTVQRDIDYLRDMLGAPVAYDRLHKGFHYTEPNWFLPALPLREGDLLAVLVGARVLEQYRGTPLASTLEDAFHRLADLLPGRITISPDLVSGAISFRETAARPVDADTWLTLVRGILHQRCVKLRYQAADAHAPSDRIIEPYHLAGLRGEWYVLGRCRKAEALRQFALPRIQKATLCEQTFQRPADFDPEAILSATFGRFVLGGQTHKVHLRFDAEVAPWVTERVWHPRQTLRRLKGGAIELSFETPGLLEVYHWVLPWGRHVRVLAPGELRDWVVEEAAAILRIYPSHPA